MSQTSPDSARRPVLGSAALALGLILCLVRARFGFEPSDAPPRVFELGLHGLGALRIEQPALVDAVGRLAAVRSVVALMAVLVGALWARLLARRLELAGGRALLLAAGLALTVFAAVDPGILGFVAGRGFAGAPHYLEVEDLLRGLGVTSVAFGALWFGAAGVPHAVSARSSSRSSLLGACAVAGLVPVLFAWIALDLEPLTNDGRAYLFQAELFASGRIVADLGAAAEAFGGRQLLPLDGGGLTSKYPPGHSLLLAPGAAFGAPRLIPWLLGALMPWAVFRIARLLGARRPLWAAWAYALSPTPLALGGLWLSHGTSLPTAVLALCFGLGALDPEASGRRRLLEAAATGLCLSICGLARPGTALAVAVPLGVGLLAQPRRLLPLGAAAVLAALPAAAFFALVNQAVTGDALRPAYLVYAETISPDDRWGLVNLAGAPTSLSLNAARAGLWLHGCGLSAALAWIGLASWSGRGRVLLVGVPLALAGFYSLLTFHGVPWAGPLYWVEGFALLAVLSSEGLVVLSERLGRRIPSIALGAGLLGSALLLAARVPLAAAELDLRRAHVLADRAERDATGDTSERVVEVPLDSPLEVKRRFLAPPIELVDDGTAPPTVFVIEGAAERLSPDLIARPRWRFERAAGAVEPR